MGHPVCRQANLAAVSPVLESLSLDDGYRLDFSPDVQDYTVFLPVGRPRIPRIHAAAAEGTTVTVYPAALADADVEGTAYVLLCSGGAEQEYRIRFIRTAELGFVLQYADQYAFTPSLTGVLTFATDSDAVNVSTQGVVTAKAVTDSPVRVTAFNDQGERETLTIQKIVPAQVDLIMSVGQSNAYGSGGNPDEAEPIRPGIGYDIGYDGDTQATNFNQTPIPLKNTEGVGTAVSGLRQAFANRWYALTGEKSLFLNAADPGIGIDAWQADGATWRGAKTEYDRVVALIAENHSFELYRQFYYFNHGSSAAGKKFDAEYYRKLIAVFDLLAAETGLEFGTVFEFFASDRDYTSWIRAQHHRAIAARRDLWMGCSMKAYIQTDASLINSDVLHLSQKGHNLCGRLLAEGTLAAIYPPQVEALSSPSTAPPLAAAPSLMWGEMTLDGAAVALGQPIKLTTVFDWTLSFTLALDRNAPGQLVLLGSEDGSSSLSVDLVSVGVQGIALTCGLPGQLGRRVTLSVRDSTDFYQMNTWRLSYASDEGLLYLWRGGELQSTELFPAPLCFTCLGGSAGLDFGGTAKLTQLALWTSEVGRRRYRFTFQETCIEENDLLRLSAEREPVWVRGGYCLHYASNLYRFAPVTLRADDDWTLEFRGSFAKNTGILNAADGAQTIFAHVSDPSFRVRTSLTSEQKFSVLSSDFAQMHTWRFAYSAAGHQLALERDGEQIAVREHSSEMTFSVSGKSGDAGRANRAELDYLEIRQAGVNRSGGDEIRFDFDRSLTDNSGGYTMELENGKTAYTRSAGGILFEGAAGLMLETPVTLKGEWTLCFNTAFAALPAVLADRMIMTAEGLCVDGITLAHGLDASALSMPVEWRLDRAADGRLTLSRAGRPLAVASLAGCLTLSKLGGGGRFTLYTWEMDIASADQTPSALNVTLTGDAAAGETLYAAVRSDVWSLDAARPRYAWYRDGRRIGGASGAHYTPGVNDLGAVISCTVTLAGAPALVHASAVADAPVGKICGALPACPKATTCPDA